MKWKWLLKALNLSLCCILLGSSLKDVSGKSSGRAESRVDFSTSVVRLIPPP